MNKVAASLVLLVMSLGMWFVVGFCFGVAKVGFDFAVALFGA